MKNVVLTGMSGVGKSKIGRLLSEKTDFKHVDIDDLIVERERRSIDEIFKLQGEEYFREIESQIIKEVSFLDNLIISTGGGAVLREDNIANLKKSGYIFLLLGKIQTIVDNLNKSSIVRPLLSNKSKLYEDVEKLFKNRELLYRSTANITIDIEGKNDLQICEEIMNIYYKL